ncbi:MAG: hypothetical protein JRN21_09555 [Nitrososphaerota archaeon]|nr:hypothetical protein [Nitrososphaerota archaeon]
MGEGNPNYGIFPSAKKAARFMELSERAMDGGLPAKELNEWARLYVLAKGVLPGEMELRRGRLVYKTTGKQVVASKLTQAD